MIRSLCKLDQVQWNASMLDKQESCVGSDMLRVCNVILNLNSKDMCSL